VSGSNGNGNGAHRAKKFLWKNRLQDLAQVKRYHRIPLMFYRTNNAGHSERVVAIVKKLLPAAQVLYPEIDPELTVLISKHHDDYEMASEQGDVPAQYKLLMNGDQKFALKQEELFAAEFLSKSYRNPAFGKGRHRYLDLLKRSIVKDCPEAQLHSLADKIDAFGEATHEVLAGNILFNEPYTNYVRDPFGRLPAEYPLIADLFGDEKSIFRLQVIQSLEYCQLYGGRLHTEASARAHTGNSYYDLWKQVTLSMPGGLERLTTQVEFHSPQPVS
jgi:hypothetical protein